MGIDDMFKKKFGDGTVDPFGVDKPQVMPTSNNELLLTPQLPGMVELLKNDHNKYGQITDTRFRIPVTVGNETDVWVYDSKEERDINVQNFQEHAINIFSSLNKWYTASSIYGEVIGLKELAYKTWLAQTKYTIRRQYNPSGIKASEKLTEAALDEIIIIEFGRAYSEYNADLITLRYMKELIDKAIIRSLEEKSKQMLILGGQFRDERKQQEFLIRQ